MIDWHLNMLKHLFSNLQGGYLLSEHFVKLSERKMQWWDLRPNISHAIDGINK